MSVSGWENPIVCETRLFIILLSFSSSANIIRKASSKTYQSSYGVEKGASRRGHPDREANRSDKAVLIERFKESSRLIKHQRILSQGCIVHVRSKLEGAVVPAMLNP